MKKIVLCAAVSAICAAPVTAMAEANFYGQLRVSLDSISDGAANDGLTVTDNTSVLGFKAASEGDGVKAFVHLQSGAQADGNATAFTSRFYFGGLKGGFGTVVYGRMTNAYKMPGFKLDPFYNHSSVNASASIAGGGATYGLSGATNGFTNNSLQYTTTSMGGVKVNAGVYVDDSTADEHGMGIGALYNSGGINAGFQFASNGTSATIPGVFADGDAMRVHGGYKADSFSVGGSFEIVDDSATTDVTYIYLTAKSNVSDTMEAAFSLGSVSDGAAEGTGITAGVFKTIAPKTQVFVSFSTVSLETTGATEPSVFSLGAIHKF
jgi:hypothetical protein